MSNLIEQTQAEMQDSHAFSRRAQIVGIKISSAVFSAPRALPLELEEALSVGIRFAPQDASITDGCAIATTFFECVITESADTEDLEPIAKFECSLAATYHLADDFIPSEVELAAFHKANVIFNCWPYFREFVQSSACRMNIPPPPVPFVRVQVVQTNRPISVSITKKKSKKALKGTRA
jgi:hypothetical protein